MRRLSVIAAVVLAVQFAVTTESVAAAATLAPPNSMAAIGDSVTQAADVCCWYGDHPANSWSTGSAGWDGILSHYERIRAINPTITGRNYNDSVSGARMADGPGQARNAVNQGVKYVTILLGANDLCTSSVETMTTVEDFEEQLRQTLQILDAGLSKKARVFVSSIPNVYQLWALYKDDATASLVWDTAGICGSLLSSARTDQDRTAVAERNQQFNAVLASECTAMSICRYDGGAVYNYQFAKGDVSRLDYFHPSLTGQAKLAQITWATSWWNT